MKYSDKLKDPRWQRRRLEVLSRDDFQCQCCGDKEATLHVHHKQYHGNPWDAHMDSLETLCEVCHEYRAELNRRFLDLPSGFVIEFMGEFMKWDCVDACRAICDLRDRKKSHV